MSTNKIPSPQQSFKSWQRQMYAMVKTAAQECEYDIVNLYLKLERVSKTFLQNGQMKEGDSFNVPLENGILMKISFYNDYSTVEAEMEDGTKREAISKTDSYKKEYRYLIAMSDALKAVELGIGVKYPKAFEDQLRNANVGDLIVFDNNRSYVVKYNFPEFISLVPTHGLQKTPKIEDFDTLPSVSITHGDVIGTQPLYRQVADPYTYSVKLKTTTLSDARAVLNKLFINKSETKEISIGPNKFVVQPSKTDKGLVFFDSKGNSVSEDRMLYYLGWLEAAPNKVSLNTVEPVKDDEILDYDVVMEDYENAIKAQDFKKAAALLVNFCAAHNGNLQIDMSSYEKIDDSYHAVSYEISAKNGGVSIKKVEYENDDFGQNISSVKDASIEDIVEYMNNRYDEKFALLKNSFIEKVLSDKDHWKFERVSAISDGIIKRLMADTPFLKTTLSAPQKDTSALINALDDIEQEER